jgi:hypothetical protein
MDAMVLLAKLEIALLFIFILRAWQLGEFA